MHTYVYLYIIDFLCWTSTLLIQILTYLIPEYNSECKSHTQYRCIWSRYNLKRGPSRVSNPTHASNRWITNCIPWICHDAFVWRVVQFDIIDNMKGGMHGANDNKINSRIGTVTTENSQRTTTIFNALVRKEIPCDGNSVTYN